MRQEIVRPFGLFVAAAVFIGCTGTVVTPAARDRNGAPEQCAPRAAITGESQRLTALQVQNALADLLGFVPTLAPGFPDAERALGYTTTPETNRINRADVAAIADTADDVALQAIDHLDRLLPCGAGAIDDACVGAFIDDFGPRVARGAWVAEDGDRLKQLYRTLRTGEEPLAPEIAVAGVISVMLQSPGFLYLVEQGEPAAEPGERRLTGREIANRIAFLFSDAPPDASLLEAAASGGLLDPAGRRAHAERLLAAPAGRHVVTRFFREWFGVGQREGGGDEALMAALDEELRRDVEEIVFDTGAGGLASIVSGDTTYVNRALAEHYGLSTVPASDDEWVRVTVPREVAAGLLSRGAVATVHTGNGSTSIVGRGLFVRTRLLCDTIGSPPDGAQEQAARLGEDATVREISDSRMSVGLCRGCHALMDPIGIGMEDLDAFGRYRDVYPSGGLVDREGAVAGLDGYDVPFEGVHELGQSLATSDALAECAAREWFHFAMGRRERACQAGSMHEAFERSGYDVREMVLSVVESDAFVQRTDAP